MAKTFEITGSLIDDLKTLVNMYEPYVYPNTDPENPPMLVGRPTSLDDTLRFPITTIPSRSATEERELVDRTADRMRELFPDSQQPSQEDLYNTMVLIQFDEIMVDQILFLCEDYGIHNKINNIGALFRASVNKYKDNKKNLQFQYDQTKSRQQKDSTSVITTALKVAERRIKTASRTSEPNLENVSRLRALVTKGDGDAEQRT